MHRHITASATIILMLLVACATPTPDPMGPLPPEHRPPPGYPTEEPFIAYIPTNTPRPTLIPESFDTQIPEPENFDLEDYRDFEIDTSRCFRLPEKSQRSSHIPPELHEVMVKKDGVKYYCPPIPPYTLRIKYPHLGEELSMHVVQGEEALQVAKSKQGYGSQVLDLPTLQGKLVFKTTEQANAGRQWLNDNGIPSSEDYSKSDGDLGLIYSLGERYMYIVIPKHLLLPISLLDGFSVFVYPLDTVKED